MLHTTQLLHVSKLRFYISNIKNVSGTLTLSLFSILLTPLSSCVCVSQLRTNICSLICYLLSVLVPAVIIISFTTSISLSDHVRLLKVPQRCSPLCEVIHCHKHLSPSLYRSGTHQKAKAHPSPPPSPFSSSFPPFFANIHESFVIKCGVEVNLCCRHWLSLLLIDLFLGQNELLCSLLSFVLQPPSSSLQLLLKLLRLTKVNGSGCPLLLLFMAIDRGGLLGFHPSRWCLNRVCWVFGLTKCGLY